VAPIIAHQWHGYGKPTVNDLNSAFLNITVTLCFHGRIILNSDAQYAIFGRKFFWAKTEKQKQQPSKNTTDKPHRTTKATSQFTTLKLVPNTSRLLRTVLSGFLVGGI